jgi:hypothetical protein
VLFTTLLVPGSITGVNVTASGVGGLLNAWLVLSLSKQWTSTATAVGPIRASRSSPLC